MAVDTKDLLEAAEKLGKLVTDHPVLTRYTEASKSLSADSEATRLLADMDKEIQLLTQQEQQGVPPTAAQRQKVQTLQATLASNLKVKNFTLAQYELTDLLRQISQAWQKPIAAAQKAAGSGKPSAPASKLVV
jgi:cell fate (sporulation/competence/biofilm development) regulator YlbF (YheA/YmcA/DUF963 family)